MSEKILTEIRGVPPRQTIRAYRGDTFRKIYRFKDGEDPKDISADTFEFVVKRDRDHNGVTPLIEATEFITRQSKDGEDDPEFTGDDEVEVVISKEKMSVPAGDWAYDFRRIDAVGDRKTKVTGPFLLAQDV